MTEQSPPPPPNPEVKPVPQELLGQLHDANARYHEGREQVEAAMDAPEYRHQERVSQAEEQLRQAEHDIEEIEGRISEELEKPS